MKYFSKSSVTIVVILVTMMFIGTVFVRADGDATRDNFAGGSTAVAWKDVVVVNFNSWNGQIRSYMSPSYDIGTIGWTWWTIRELCAGNILEQYQYSGQVYYGKSYIADSAVDDMDSCGWQHRGTVLGTHDFKNGGDVWRPDFFHSEVIQ